MTNGMAVGSPSPAQRETDRVDGPRAPTELAQPAGDRLAREPPRRARRILESFAEREAGRQRRGVRAARAVGRAVGVPRRPRSAPAARRRRPAAGRSRSRGGHPSARRRPRRARAPPRASRSASSPSAPPRGSSPSRARASSTFGVHVRGQRQHRPVRAPAGRPARAGGRRTRPPSPGRGPPGPRCGAPAGAPRRRASWRAHPAFPTLTASDADVFHDRPHLRPHDLGRHRVNRNHAKRVLGRDRGDRAGAVNAASGERLQVGLYAGAAAGVRAGDRQGYGRPVGHRADASALPGADSPSGSRDAAARAGRLSSRRAAAGRSSRSRSRSPAGARPRGGSGCSARRCAGCADRHCCGRSPHRSSPSARS